jgi:hypothetical protein
VRVIGPLCVAEIGRCAREDIGQELLPDGIYEIGGGFDDDGLVVGATEEEFEFVALYGCIANLKLWSQHDRGQTVKGRAPAGGASLIINFRDGCVDTEENIFVRRGGIPKAVNGDKVVALVKRILLDVGDAGRNGNAGQSRAFTTHFFGNGAKMAGQRDVGQAAALKKHIITKVGDAAGKCDARQAGAVSEYFRCQSADIGANGDAGHGGFAKKCLSCNSDDGGEYWLYWEWPHSQAYRYSR